MALTAVCCCLGAAAYAATKPGIGGIDVREASRPLKPRLTKSPPTRTVERHAEFRFVQPSRPPARARSGTSLTLECRLDDGYWKNCESPELFGGLGLGRHRLDVRAVNGAGRRGPTASRVWWVTRTAEPAPQPLAAPTVAPVIPVTPEVPVEPRPPSGKPLEIEVDSSALQLLYPGEPAQRLPLTISNPNSAPVFVTTVTFDAETEVAGCDVAANFELIQATVSAQLPLKVPAEGSAALPAAGGLEAPEIAMRDLPYPQDVCQGAQLELNFQAQAHG